MSPSGSILQPLEHSFFAPKFEDAMVVDAMRLGAVSCSADTPIREAARIMATYRIHSIVVFDLVGGPWGLLSDLDLVRAADEDLDKRTVGEVASMEFVTVPGKESLARAARLMAERGVSHLVVVSPDDGHPLGVLSTLDVAGVLAWGGSS
jgi:CBS domain-containing protein